MRLRLIVLAFAVAACGGAASNGPSAAAPVASVPSSEPTVSPAAVPREATDGPANGPKPSAESAHEADENDEEGVAALFKVPVGKSPTRGSAAAPITIVEFADYQCPYCWRAETTMRALRAAYGERLRFVFKDTPLPFHDRAEPAAEAALEVRAQRGDSAFWKMHDLLFDSRGDLSDDTLVRLATLAGARGDKLRTALAEHTHRAEIELDEDLAEGFQVEGTPHFFINGRRVVGAQPTETFIAIVEEELKKAQALVDAGTRPEAIYDALTKEGRGPAEPEQRDVTPLPGADPAKGPPGAGVTIHEFADFQCPFCVRVEATLRQIAKEYGNRVRFVWHDLPLPMHDRALSAARAGREAQTQGGDAAFWQLHDRLLSGHGLSRDDLDANARALGLNATKWAAALDGDVHDSAIDADRSAAAALGFEGTPSFVIVPGGAKRGYVLVGAQGYGKFHNLIERALSEARR